MARSISSASSRRANNSSFSSLREETLSFITSLLLVPSVGTFLGCFFFPSSSDTRQCLLGSGEIGHVESRHNPASFRSIFDRFNILGYSFDTKFGGKNEKDY